MLIEEFQLEKVLEDDCIQELDKLIWLIKRRKMEVDYLKLKKIMLGTNMKKSIRTSRSFSVEITNYSRMSEYISMFASRCSEKLRLENACASSISIFMYTNRFKPKNHQHSGYISMDFQTATSDTITITKLAIKCLEKIYRYGCS